ncbi:MAG: type II secretion system protein N [Planctomycetota bacterium]|jgi:type II secretion system protein C
MKSAVKLGVRKILFLSKLALVLTLGYVVLHTVVTFLASDEIFAPKSAAGLESLTAEELSSRPEFWVDDYSAIVEHNIFCGSALSLDPKTFLPGSDGGGPGLPAEEELGLALVGTVAGNPFISRAIIEDLGTSALGLYKPGDSIAEALIERIDEDVVVLRHQGQRKTLNLGAKAHAPRAGDSTRSAPQENDAQPIETTAADASGGSYRTVRTKLRNLETVLKKAIIKPYNVDGQVQGLRITGLEKVEGAHNLGLRNGDVVRTVNGHRLTSKQKAYQVFKKARSQAALTVELLRDNEIEMLLFSLK